MPDQDTIERAEKDKRQGKSPSTQAGEFVREEIHHVREGKHGAASAKQAIAIGLSKARRAGVKLPPPEKGEAPEASRKSARRALAVGEGHQKKVSRARSQATRKALQEAGRSAASPTALARQARGAAKKRTAAERSAAARKAARTRAAAAKSRHA